DMGRQIRFYMVDQDEEEFIAFVKTTGDLVILPQASESNGGETFSSLRELDGRRLGESCHLWNRSLSPEPAIKHIPQHGCYWLDFMQSEVVNVMRSKRVGQTLSMGRLHIEGTVARPDGSAVEKSDAFLEWFKELCHWIRKNCPGRYDAAYVSARAENLSMAGIELTGHRL